MSQASYQASHLLTAQEHVFSSPPRNVSRRTHTTSAAVAVLRQGDSFKPTVPVSSRANLERVERQFNSFIAYFKKKHGAPPKISGQAVHSWTDATKTHIAPWDMNILKPYFTWFVKKTKPRKKMFETITQSTLRTHALAVRGAYFKARGASISELVVKDLDELRTELANAYKLPLSRAPKARLTTKSVRCLIRGCTFVRRRQRCNLSAQAYVSCASSSGLRCSSLLKCRSRIYGVVPGAAWKHATFWAMRAAEGKPNRIVVWYRQPFNKAHKRIKMAFPFREGDTIDSSPSLLLLACAALDDCFAHDISHYLDPDFLQRASHRQIPIKEAKCVRRVKGEAYS